MYKKQWSPHVKKQWPPHVKKCPADFPTPMAEFPTRMADFSRSGVVTKTFAPKFCAEWSNREVHSSHGDHFCDNFCVYVSRPCLGAQKLAPVQKNIVAKSLAPKFCAKWSDREMHSSHGDYFRDHFCLYVSGPLSGSFRV